MVKDHTFQRVKGHSQRRCSIKMRRYGIFTSLLQKYLNIRFFMIKSEGPEVPHYRVCTLHSQTPVTKYNCLFQIIAMLRKGETVEEVEWWQWWWTWDNEQTLYCCISQTVKNLYTVTFTHKAKCLHLNFTWKVVDLFRWHSEFPRAFSP